MSQESWNNLFHAGIGAFVYFVSGPIFFVIWCAAMAFDKLSDKKQ